MRSRPQPSVQELYEAFQAETNPGQRSTAKPPLESTSNGSAGDPERSGRASLSRHARKCAICNHADRASIESDFISWRSETVIALDYRLPSRSTVYLHAAATGLVERRRLNLRGVCERIIERVEDAPPSAHAVLRALRIFAQITEDGHWLEPAKRSIVTHIHITKHDAPSIPTCHQACPEERREPSAPPVRDGGEGPAVAVDFPGAPSPASSEEDVNVPGESAPNSADAPSADSPDEIFTNTRRDNRLPWQYDPETLIGTQNTSPEDATDTENGT
jgi:hypothetical protein